MKKNNPINKIGSIDLSTGFVCIADPCYTRYESPCAIWDLKIQEGKYDCYVSTCDISSYNDFLKAIYIVSIDRPIPKAHLLESFDWVLFPKRIDVDSGQAGFFKSSIYNDTEYIESDNFFDDATRLTMTKEGYGILDSNGFVASSGFGDGTYSLYTIQDNDTIFGLKLVFIEDE